MKVSIDASIFTRERGAFGNVEGMLDLAFEPQIGDTISLMQPSDGAVPVAGYGRTYRIRDRVLQANTQAGNLSLMLEDIVVESVADALAVARYLENGFGLFVNIYNEADIPPTG